MEYGSTTLSTYRIVLLLGLRQRQYIVGYVFHTLFTQSWSPSRHHAYTAFGNGFADFLRRAAPQPIGIGQVGKAFGTFGIRAVALNTVGIE